MSSDRETSSNDRKLAESYIVRASASAHAAVAAAWRMAADCYDEAGAPSNSPVEASEWRHSGNAWARIAERWAKAAARSYADDIENIPHPPRPQV